MRRLKLLSIAIAGTLIGYTIVNSFIIPVSIWQYLGIELTITLLHILYNRAKIEEQKHLVDEQYKQDSEEKME